MNPVVNAIHAELQDLRGHLHQLADLASPELPAHQSAALLLELADVNRALGERIAGLHEFRSAAKETPVAALCCPAGDSTTRGEGIGPVRGRRLL